MKDKPKVTRVKIQHNFLKVRTTLYSTINSTTGEYCSVAFIWMVTPQDFIHRLKSSNYLVQHNKQYHRKALLSSFHLNGHTIGFHSQTQTFEPPCKASQTAHSKEVLSSFDSNGHTTGFGPQSSVDRTSFNTRLSIVGLCAAFWVGSSEFDSQGELKSLVQLIPFRCSFE